MTVVPLYVHNSIFIKMSLRSSVHDTIDVKNMKKILRNMKNYVDNM